MKSSFRWYGDSDPVTLDMIRQIPGMRSIVSAVYDVKPGEVWPEESIKHLVDECAEKGLIFDVVESIPVTEEIKLVCRSATATSETTASPSMPLREVRHQVRDLQLHARL